MRATSVDRRQGTAAVLSFIFPGLGHVYVRRARQGISYAVLILVLKTTLGFWGAGNFYPLWLMTVAAFGIFAYSVADAWRAAGSVGATTHGGYRQWWVFVLYAACWTGADFIIKDQMRFVPFRIPSDSMSPVLVAGDHIYIDRMAYSRPEDIRRGDVIVFKHPVSPEQLYLKRVTAVHGDPGVVNGTIHLGTDNPDFARSSNTQYPIPVENVVGRARYVWASFLLGVSGGERRVLWRRFGTLIE